MLFAKDFEDFIALLNRYKVKYMVVGGYALAFHGKPRHTGDLDIWIDISDVNASKLLRVMDEFGLSTLNFSREDFLKEAMITQIGGPPLRIDILNSIDGVTFKIAYKKRETIVLDQLKIQYIGLGEFIKNKKASGRPRDIADIHELQALKSKGKKTRKG